MLRDDAIKKGLIKPVETDTVKVNDVDEAKQPTKKQNQDIITEPLSDVVKPKTQAKRRGRKPTAKN